MRRLILLTALSSLLAVGVLAADADSVLLLTRRGGFLEAIDPQTLDTVSRVRVPWMTESVAAAASGQLFLTAPKSKDSGCCALYALDEQSMQLSFLVAPALAATATGSHVFTQRGNTGIEVFDRNGLNRLPTMQAPGVYRLRASPDGHLLFGTNNWQQPSLELFDAIAGKRIAVQPLPGASSLAGVWMAKQYYLFGIQSRQAKLWPVNSESGELGQAVALPMSLSMPDCHSSYNAIAVGNRLAIYEESGSKGDMGCGPGGFVSADPVTGRVSNRLAPGLHFRQMITAADGKSIVGLDVGNPLWGQVRLVKMDAATGRIIAEHALVNDVWYLSEGPIARDWIGHLDLTAISPPDQQ